MPLLSVASSPSLGLEADLRVRLHGQHLARELVLTAVRGYLEMPRPDKALALSFHGWSGTGKNFVARMLAENLYQDGLRSDCVKVFISTLHFPHPKNVDLYEVRPAVLRSLGEGLGPTEAWAAETQAWVLGERLKPALGVGVGGQQGGRDDAVTLRDSYSTGEAQEGLSLTRESICSVCKLEWKCLRKCETEQAKALS